MKQYLVSKEEIVEAVEKFGKCHKPLVDILLESKTPVEEIEVLDASVVGSINYPRDNGKKYKLFIQEVKE